MARTLSPYYNEVDWTYDGQTNTSTGIGVSLDGVPPIHYINGGDPVWVPTTVDTIDDNGFIIFETVEITNSASILVKDESGSLRTSKIYNLEPGNKYIYYNDSIVGTARIGVEIAFGGTVSFGGRDWIPSPHETEQDIYGIVFYTMHNGGDKLYFSKKYFESTTEEINVYDSIGLVNHLVGTITVANLNNPMVGILLSFLSKNYTLSTTTQIGDEIYFSSSSGSITEPVIAAEYLDYGLI